MTDCPYRNKTKCRNLQASLWRRNVTKVLLALLLILLPLATTAAEHEADKLIEAFNKLEKAETANKFFDYLNSKEFTDSKIHFSTNASTDSLRQQVWYWAAEWYNDIQDYNRAKSYALKALPLFKQDNTDRADCLNLLGIIHVRLGDFATAASYAKKCADINMALGDADKISSSLNTLAGIYLSANQAATAEKFILQGIEYANQANNPGRKAILLGMASEIYHKLGKDQYSLDYAQKAFAIDSLYKRKPKMAIRLSQMASALAGLQRYDDSEQTYIRAIALLKDMGNLHSAGIALNQLGFVYLKQKRHSEAVKSFAEAAGIFSKMGDLYNCVYSHKGLYESYWPLNPDSSKVALERYNMLKDSLYHQASADALAKYNAEFGNNQLQEEIRQTKAEHTRNIVAGIVALLVLTGIAVVIARTKYQRQQLQMRILIKKVEELEMKCNEAEKNLHTLQKDDTTIKTVYETKDKRQQEFLSQLFATASTVLTNKDYGVAKIAAMMNMTERTFSRRLKEITKQPPKMFISAIQMERCAKLLLENPDKTISEIANLCGFDEASGFSHAFKRVYGCSPTVYREQHSKC